MVIKYDIKRFPKLEDGCELHLSCFTCPFKDCIYGGSRAFLLKQKRAERNRAIIRGIQDGKSIAELALEYGVSERTIQRILRHA